MTGISEEDYQTALFEIGSTILEERYGCQNAQVMLRKKGCWMWLREQRDIADKNLCNVLKSQQIPKGSGVFRMYHKALREHLESVYFPERLENKLLEKEVCNG